MQDADVLLEAAVVSVPVFSPMLRVPNSVMDGVAATSDPFIREPPVVEKHSLNVSVSDELPTSQVAAVPSRISRAPVARVAPTP